MPAAAAAAAKEQARANAAPRSRWIWWVLINAMALVLIFALVLRRGNHGNDAAEITLPPGYEKMLHKAMHKASEHLTVELQQVARTATQLAANEATLLHLEKAHPNALIQMLRYAIGLNRMLNATELDRVHDAEEALKLDAR